MGRPSSRVSPARRRGSTPSASGRSSPPATPTCWCSTAPSRPSRSTRCSWSRRPGLAGTTPTRSRSSSCIGVQSPQEATESVAYCSVRRAGAGSPRTSTPISPISAAALEDAITRLSRSMWRLPRCSFRPAGAPRPRPVRSVPIRHQASCLPHAHADQRRPQVRASIQAFAADHVLDGGGSANYSASVATVGATAAIGIYDIPKVDVGTLRDTVAR